VGKVGLCPPDTPFWNEKTLFCERCAQTSPLWDPLTKTCSACLPNTVYDSALNQCKSNVQCPGGSLYSATSKKCELVKCTPNTPVFNAQKNVCETCPEDYIFNFSTNIC
jgi:ribosomal protein L37E